VSCELSVILPAYNEEENLRLLVPRIRHFCQEMAPSFEIIVVDTMSPMDGTAELCEEQGIRYLNRTGGDRYGDAVRTGIAQSTGRFLIFMDADGSHPPHFLQDLYRARDQADVIIASRYVSGGFTENSVALVLMSWVVNVGYRFVLGLNCKDVSNSFKLYPGDAIRRLELRCRNFDVVEEILVKVMRQNPGFRLLEVPFTFKKRMFGQTKRNLLAFVFSYLATLIRLRFSR
jgi:dolichol-phosphate mannosyltransferase